MRTRKSTKKNSSSIHDVIEIDEFDVDPWADIERQFDREPKLRKQKGMAAKRKIERWQEDRLLMRDDMDTLFASFDREDRRLVRH